MAGSREASDPESARLPTSPSAHPRAAVLSPDLHFAKGVERAVLLLLHLPAAEAIVGVVMARGSRFVARRRSQNGVVAGHGCCGGGGWKLVLRMAV